MVRWAWQWTDRRRCDIRARRPLARGSSRRDSFIPAPSSLFPELQQITDPEPIASRLPPAARPRSVWRRFMLGMAGSFAAVTLVLFGFVAVVDPWGALPLAPALPRLPVTSNSAYALPMLARSEAFELRHHRQFHRPPAPPGGARPVARRPFREPVVLRRHRA